MIEEKTESVGSGLSKYAEVLADLERRIASGEFVAGRKLPSVREAAGLYGCSVNTVIRAYAELEKRHAVYVMPRSGHYVVENPSGRRREAEEGVLVDLAASTPDPELFPLRDFRHCLDQALDTWRNELFTCADERGFEPLRSALVPHLAADQVFAAAERMRALAEALDRHGAGERVGAPDVRTGLYLPLMLPRTVNLERLARRLSARGVRVVSGKACYLKSYRDWVKFLRLSVARAIPERIDEGVRRIAEEARLEAGRP
jgi:DNA-binding transcriptional MocR family regulator